MDENETVDQVQDETPTVEQPAEQSETTKDEQDESNLYELPDGRKLPGDQLREEYLKLNSEFTRRSQKLSEFERVKTETESRNKRAAEEALSQSKLLEDVDPNVRDTIIQIVTPAIEEAVGRSSVEAQKVESQKQWDSRVSDLEKKYPGGSGLPKFDRTVILREMQKPGNEIYDPEVLYQQMNWDAWIDSKIKMAMKGKAGGVSTESTSTDAPRKPGEGKTPTTWSEASKRATSRF